MNLRGFSYALDQGPVLPAMRKLSLPQSMSIIQVDLDLILEKMPGVSREGKGGLEFQKMGTRERAGWGEEGPGQMPGGTGSENAE